METVVIVIHLMIVLALIVVVLLQRSEGGALGIGGGGGGSGGGFMSARGAANALSRTTGILAIAFFATSLTLGVLAKFNAGPASILDQVPAGSSQGSGNGILDQLRPEGATQEPENNSPVPTGE